MHSFSLFSLCWGDLKKQKKSKRNVLTVHNKKVTRNKKEKEMSVTQEPLPKRQRVDEEEKGDVKKLTAPDRPIDSIAVKSLLHFHHTSGFGDWAAFRLEKSIWATRALICMLTEEGSGSAIDPGENDISAAVASSSASRKDLVRWLDAVRHIALEERIGSEGVDRTAMDATAQGWFRRLDVIRDDIIRQCGDLAELVGSKVP